MKSKKTSLLISPKRGSIEPLGVVMQGRKTISQCLVKADYGICQDDPNIYGTKPLHTKTVCPVEM